MTKDEYTEKLNEYADDNDLEREDGLTYLDGIQDAAALARQLDEPKKVVIPQFVADWIEEAKVYYSNEVDPLGIIYYMGDYIGSKEPHCEWLKNIYNQKLLLNAIANGYEVEKEPKYRVPLPNLNSDNGEQLITYKNGKWFACAHRNDLQQEFTEVELANLPEPYCDYERVKVKRLMTKDKALFAKFLEQRFNHHSQDMIKTLLAIDKSMTKLRYNHYDVFKAYKKLSSQQKNHIIAEILSV